MLTIKEILKHLDATYTFGDYYQFIQLGHPYSYLIDSRLNIFKGDNDQWAIAAERLGYNERGGEIELEIYYYGNCLINLDEYNNQPTNYYSVGKIDGASFFATTDGPCLKDDARYWIIGKQKVELSVDKRTYLANGIKLKLYEPDEIRAEEAARLVMVAYSNLLRANNTELYKSIPSDLKKISVIDEWHHRDFLEIKQPNISDDKLRSIYDFNKSLESGNNDMDFQTLSALIRQQEERTKKFNTRNRNRNRPGSYETWQQIAKVIVTGDVSYYQPTLKANSHWKHWPASGSL